MIDHKFIESIAHEFSGVDLALDVARTMAVDTSALLEAVRREGKRLNFEDSPRSFETLISS